MKLRTIVQYATGVGVALGLTLTSSAQAATNCGSPGANQVIVWQHDFTGNCDVLNLGNHPFSEILSLSVGNDQISSVSVGSNVRVTLF